LAREAASRNHGRAQAAAHRGALSRARRTYEKLAAEQEREPEKAPKPATRRARPQYVPDSIPSKLDAARARAVLKKLGLE